MNTIIGKLIKKLPIEMGRSERGDWTRGGFILETESDYPKLVAFQLLGEERIAMIENIQEGQLVNVAFTPESREYNDKWYTNLRCNKVDTIQMQEPSTAPAATSTPQKTYAEPSSTAIPTDTELPF
ncbi:MAG: DUF3127 domain-containing protein [Bacteroidales bacterium]|nr:DUF3127 domain-containing protein [Bacteroidales bacterium]